MKELLSSILAIVFAMLIAGSVGFAIGHAILNDPFKAVAYMVLAWTFAKAGDVLLED